MWRNLSKHWFLASLAICFAVGYGFADSLASLSDQTALRDGLVFAVMWLMGVTLKSDTIRQSLRKPTSSLLAIGINILVVPLLCLPLIWVLPANLFGGLFVAAIVPCTLASASVWTRKAGGDDSIAMMTTVVTNLACIVVAPIGIALVLSQQAEIDALAQMKKLALLVVAPLVLAQLMRRFGLAIWADRTKPRISLLAQIGILAMVVFGAIRSGNQPITDDSPTGWIPGIGVVLAAAAIHIIALMIGVFAARQSGQSRDRQIAVGIAGSQKTLMVGLQIAIDCGVSVIPMLVYHLSQLIIDTVIADRWKAVDTASNQLTPNDKTPDQSE